jgi:hypothetical protein
LTIRRRRFNNRGQSLVCHSAAEHKGLQNMERVS